MTEEENLSVPKIGTREVAFAIFGLWTLETIYLLHWADAGRVDLLEPVYQSLSGMAMIAVPLLLGIKATQVTVERHSRRRTRNPRLDGEGEIEGAG